MGKQDGKRPKLRDCEKERIRIPNLFPLLFFSSLHPFYMARPRAYSDDTAAEWDRRITVLLMAESQRDVSDTLSKKLLQSLRSDSPQTHYNKLKLSIKSSACKMLMSQAELTLTVDNGLKWINVQCEQWFHPFGSRTSNLSHSCIKTMIHWQ